MTFDPAANDLADLGALKTFLSIAAGKVLEINVTAGGEYSQAPAVSLVGKGTGFSGTATIDGTGAVIGVTVQKQGWNYDAAATTVVFDDTFLTGAPATATANIEELDSKADAQLSRLISAASNLAIDYANLVVAATSAELESTELYDGGGTATQLLGRYPVTAVAEVKIDGKTIDKSVADSNGILQNGWIWDPGRPDVVQLLGFSFSAGIQNVSIKYTAGYVKGESYKLQMAEEAVLIIAAAHWNRRDSFGFASKNLAGERGTTIAYSRDDIPLEATVILDRLRVPVAA